MTSGPHPGSATAPTSASQVFHFLLVTVSGTTVTVAPTDETGRTLDDFFEYVRKERAP